MSNRKFTAKYAAPPELQGLNPADFVASQATASIMTKNLKFLQSQVADWTTEIESLSKVLAADFADWTTKTTTAISTLAQMQDELLHVSFERGVDFENRFLAAKDDPVQQQRLREISSRVWVDLHSKYAASITAAAQNLTYKRKHFSRLWLDSWDHLDKVATNLYNSFLTLDTDITHWANCDISPLLALRTKLEARGCQLPEVAAPLLPKELVSLCPMDARVTKKSLATRPTLDLDVPADLSAREMQRKIRLLEAREQMLKQWLETPLQYVSSHVAGTRNPNNAGTRDGRSSQDSSLSNSVPEPTPLSPPPPSSMQRSLSASSLQRRGDFRVAFVEDVDGDSDDGELGMTPVSGSHGTPMQPMSPDSPPCSPPPSRRSPSRSAQPPPTSGSTTPLTSSTATPVPLDDARVPPPPPPRRRSSSRGSPTRASSGSAARVSADEVTPTPATATSAATRPNPAPTLPATAAAAAAAATTAAQTIASNSAPADVTTTTTTASAATAATKETPTTTRLAADAATTPTHDAPPAREAPRPQPPAAPTPLRWEAGDTDSSSSVTTSSRHSGSAGGDGEGELSSPRLSDSEEDELAVDGVFIPAVSSPVVGDTEVDLEHINLSPEIASGR